MTFKLSISPSELNSLLLSLVFSLIYLVLRLEKDERTFETKVQKSLSSMFLLVQIIIEIKQTLVVWLKLRTLDLEQIVVNRQTVNNPLK